MKTRIKRIEAESGKVIYIPQYKWLLWWVEWEPYKHWEEIGGKGFTLNKAQWWIDEEIKGEKWREQAKLDKIIKDISYIKYP